MDAKIVLNAEILSPSFVPENLAYREKELALISSQAKNAVNTFIYGPSGSGKTAVLKRVCLESSSMARRVFYVDCSLYQTVNSVLREMLSDRLAFSRSNYDLLKKLKERTLQHKATVCLDHFERTKEPEIVTKLLGIGLSVVMSGNNEDNLEELDIRTRSFISRIIEFAPCSIDLATSILKSRAEQALAKFTFKESTIRKITEKTKGNIAPAITILRACALLAESQGKRAVEDVSLDDIMRRHDCPVKLSTDEKTLVKILEEWKGSSKQQAIPVLSHECKVP